MPFEVISRRSVTDVPTEVAVSAVSNLVLIETFNEGAKNHVTITYQVDSFIEECGADYSISLYGAPHTKLLIM
jgi:hypothetical protein